MSAEKIHCNGSAKPQGSPCNGLLTYRRKRTRSSTQVASPQEDASASFAPKEDASASAAGEVSNKPVPKKRSRANKPQPKERLRDIGWEHGVQVGGNRYQWRCNWCGIIRSGGVCRLKQHLAGVPEACKCPKVPIGIAKTMKKHLSPAVRKAIDMIKSPSPYVDDSLDKNCKCFDLDMDESNAILRSKKAAEHSEAGKKRSRTGTQQSKMDKAKATKKPLDAVLRTSFYGQDGLDRIDSHWRNVLVDMLQLLDVSEGGGIQSCIHKALSSGPSGFSRNFKAVDIPVGGKEPKDRHEDHCEVHDQSQRLGSSADALSDVSKTGTSDQADMNSNTMKCQNIFLNILCSEKFVLFCDLLCGNFQDKKAKEIMDFSLINSRMKNGDYEQSPGLFDQDIRQVWEKVQRIGQQMVHLASSLTNMSLASYPKRVGEDLVHEAGELQFEETCQIGVEQRNSMDSNTTTQFPLYESDRSTKPEQTEASCLYKVCTCKQCGCEADGKRSLICDGCEAMYHFSCIEPAVQEIPTLSWYCAACITSRKESPEPLTNRRELLEPTTNSRESPEPILTDVQQDRLHHNCVVCDRLEVSETQEHPNEIGGRTVIANDSRESSISSMESDEPPEPSRTAILHLCKQCGTCEDDDKRFLTCGNTHCPYKFYHIRCLKSSQIASLQQRNLPCWYCPSCLCRGCLSDKDDDRIVLCDGCDEAYHTYCMKPPRTSVPKGLWYCISCNMAKAREGMRRYEQLVLQQHGRKDVRQANEVNRSMDILLSAAEKLCSEERLAAGRKAN